MTRILFALLLFVLPAQAQIIFPAVVPTTVATASLSVVGDTVFANSGGTVATQKIAANIPSMTNGLLIVSVMWDDAVQNTTVSSVTWEGGSQSLTWLASVENATQNNRAETWYVINPTAGNDSISVTTGNNVRHVIHAVWLEGVDQGTPLGTPATNTGASSPASVDASSASGDIVVDCIIATNATWVTALTVGAGQTAISKIAESGGGDIQTGSSYETATGTPTTMSWTNAEAMDNWAMIAVAVKEN